MGGFPILTAMTFLPAAAGIVLALLRGDRAAEARAAALAVSLAVLVLAGVMWAGFDAGPSAQPFQFVESAAWVEGLGINYKMGVDGIALAMIAMTAFLVPCSVLASWRMSRGFMVALMFLETGMIGTFAAMDIFLFYVFWEATLIPMYLIIGIWGGPRRVYSAVKFILYTAAGSVLMFAAILYCALAAGTFDVVELQKSLPALESVKQASHMLFLAFAVAFAIKVPVFPFHTWLPDAHVEAPTAGSVILAGVLLKMGAYGFLRFAIPFFPESARRYTPLAVGLAVVGVVYGAAMAMAQRDIKKLVAYSSVSHLGFVMLGAFSGTVAGTQGAVVQMVNHGLSTGALFMLVGIIYERTHSRGVDDFGGMAAVVPRYAAIFMIVTLSSIGLPGLNGFVGEFLILFGSFGPHAWATAVAALGVVLGAVYMLRLYRDVFFGPVTRPERQDVADVGRLELSYLVPVTLLIVVLGVLPNALLSRTEAASAAVAGKLNPSRPVAHERVWK